MTDKIDPLAEEREAVELTALSFDDQNYYAKWKDEMDVVLQALIDAADAIGYERGKREGREEEL